LAASHLGKPASVSHLAEDLEPIEFPKLNESKTPFDLRSLAAGMLCMFSMAAAYLLGKQQGKKQPHNGEQFALMAATGSTGQNQIVYNPPAFGRTTVLDRVDTPKDMKSLSREQLKQLADELRYEVLKVVSQKGGHLGSALGVIELTVALHYVFNAPEDPIVWDVSHQCYPHKILTGRRDRMHTLRDKNGVSGFAKRSESEYDAFGAGHSSTSISAALGMAVARDRQNKPNHCVAVIGDGAITGGMAYEAMNCAAYLDSRLIVILNDNDQVSLPTGTPSAGGIGPVGSLSTATNKVVNSGAAFDIREMARSLNELLPTDVKEMNKVVDKYTRGLITGGTLFEELGFLYIGPVDGHDLDQLIPIMQRLYMHREKPVLLHVKTRKGAGYQPAMTASDKYHAVPKFDVPTGQKVKSPPVVTYTSVFADTLVGLGQDDRSVVAITAAMPGGTGIDKFGERFPSRTFDVGIAEQHAVTFAAGLAVEGLKPFCAVYSTFLQRGYDQMVHDVALQKLPVRLIMDRAGLVGHDGPTHHGSFDLSFLGCIPDLIIMAPSNELELMDMVTTAYAIDDLPTCVRYPRGSVYGIAKLKSLFGYELERMPDRGRVLPVGKGWVVHRAKEDAAQKIAILSIGTRLSAAVEASRYLESLGDIGVTVADARFMKPLDEELITELAQNHEAVIMIEENSIGGFGDHVIHFMHDAGLLDDGKVKVRSMVLPDVWIEAATWNQQIQEAGLVAADIEALALKLLGREAPKEADGEEADVSAAVAKDVSVDKEVDALAKEAVETINKEVINAHHAK
jgi:1-deoxy-D-xylulose-5-phosphate synthase